MRSLILLKQKIIRSYHHRTMTAAFRSKGHRHSSPGKKTLLFPAQLDWCGYLMLIQKHSK